MQNADYLMQNYNDGTRHAKLLHDFTGNTIEQLQSKGIYYLGWGFSYQVRGKLCFCR